MSELSYNAVQLSYVRTKQFVQEPLYTHGDGTGDYLHTRFHISCQGVLNAPSGLPPSIPADLSTTDMMDRVRQLLWVPREQLTYSVNGRTLLSSPPTSAQVSAQAQRKVDANNGPVVRNVNVTSLTENTFLVDFDVETWLQDCNTSLLGSGAGASGPQYVSNRFTTDFEVDQVQGVSIRTRGLVVARADLNVNPDVLRGVIAPTLPPGFINENSRYVVQENGLALQYNFDDKEVFRVPPGDSYCPVYEADGDFILSSPFGAYGLAEVRLMLKTRKTVDPGQLTGLCILLAIRKLVGGNTPNKLPTVKDDKRKSFILKQAALKQSWAQNQIEVHLTAQVPAPSGRVGNLAIGLGPFANNLWYARRGNPTNTALNKTQASPTLIYGTAQLRANLAWLRDPCDPHVTRGPAEALLGSPAPGTVAAVAGGGSVLTRKIK